MYDLQARTTEILDGFRQEHVQFEETVNLLHSYFQTLPPEIRREFFKTLWLQYLNDPISQANTHAVHAVVIRAWSSFGPTDDLARIVFSQGWKDENQTKAWVSLAGSELLHSLWTYRTRFPKAALDRIKAECAPFLNPRYEQLFGFQLSTEFVEFIKRLDKGVDKVIFERSVAHLKPSPKPAGEGPIESVSEPGQMDDLLPIFRKSRFQRDLDRFTTAATQAAPLGLLVIDYDEFANVNEFGHPVGDEVLVGTASAIQSVCQSKGHCYRWGGDEFAVLLPNHSPSEAAAVAERIRTAIAELKFANYPNKATVSVGVASYPTSFSSKEEFFKAADDALLAAKQAGRDRVVIAEGAAEKGAAS